MFCFENIRTAYYTERSEVFMSLAMASKSLNIPNISLDMANIQASESHYAHVSNSH